LVHALTPGLHMRPPRPTQAAAGGQGGQGGQGGGRARAGANLEVDVPWKYLNFFLEDDMRLAEIGREYRAGRMLTGEVKKELIGVRSRPASPSRAPCVRCPA